MKIKQSENELFETYIKGIAYTGVLAIILLLFCFAINDKWFDYPITFILIAFVCIVFFISGFKRVAVKNLGFLMKFGRPNFDEYLNPGLYWILPFHKLVQKTGFGILSDKEELKDLLFYTQDRIPLHINVVYYWKVTDPHVMFENDQLSVIKAALTSEISKFVQNRQSIEVLSDLDISNKMMKNYLKETGNNIGIEISMLYPTIRPDAAYDKYQNKYLELKFKIDELDYKKIDMEIEKTQILQFINELGFSKAEAFNYIKVYKNQVNINESTYNIELNEVIEAVMELLKEKKR